jgi:hypothetical protein
MTLLTLRSFKDERACPKRASALGLTTFPAAGDVEIRNILEHLEIGVADSSQEGGRLRVAFFRDPLARMVSLHGALRDERPEARAWFPDEETARDMAALAKALPVKEFASYAAGPVLEYIGNVQSRALMRDAGGDVRGLPADPVGVCALLEQAYDFIGVYEYLPLAFQVFCLALGRLPSLEVLGVKELTPLWRTEDIDPVTRAVLRERYASDILVWECAQSLFQAELDACQGQLQENEYLALREGEARGRP